MLTPDEWIYAGLLAVSVPFGYIIKTTDGRRNKQLISSGVGLCMVLIVCGVHTLHSLITVVVNIALIKLTPRKCHILSFIWCFGYLAFFRTTHFFGLPKVPPHSNAVQLILTLKMIGLAIEVHDSDKNNRAAKKEQDDTDKQKKIQLQCEYQNIEPSILDILLYSYCYIGLLTGPYYKYRTYIDTMNQDSRNIPTMERMFRRLAELPLYAASFMIVGEFYYIQYAETDEFFARPFWYRLWYMVPMFFVFRMRMYSAWILSECMCMTAALGAYPKCSKPKCGQGPDDLQALKDSEGKSTDEIEYDFETIHNIDVYGCELAPRTRDGLRAWNMTVQFWLASNIYRRVTIKPLRTSVTMIVSAFWHGIHGGYYVSFMTVPMILAAEGYMEDTFRKGASLAQQKLFDWVCWFCKMRGFDYMCMGFLLLRLDSTLRYMASVYFIVHIFVAIFICIGYVYGPKTKDRTRQQEKHKSDQVSDTVLDKEKSS